MISLNLTSLFFYVLLLSLFIPWEIRPFKSFEGNLYGKFFKKRINLDFDRNIIEDEIKKLKLNTSGNMLVVFNINSGNYFYISFIISVLLSLLFVDVIFEMDWHFVLRFILFCSTFVVVIILVDASKIKFAILSKLQKWRRVRKAAVTCFEIHRLAENKHSAGILLYVSVFEKRAELLVDWGLAKKVDGGKWKPIVDELVKGIELGETQFALRRAIECCGTILIQQFPKEDPVVQPESRSLIEFGIPEAARRP